MNNRSFCISGLLLLSAIWVVQAFLSRPVVAVVEKRLDRLPAVIDGYYAKIIPLSEQVNKALQTDVYIFRTYSGPKGSITLYIGYYGTAKGGRTGHIPTVCYPSQGYALLDEQRLTLPVVFGNGRKSKVTVTRLLVTRNGQKQIVYHWYQASGDTVLTNGIQQNLHRFKSLWLYNRNDGAFVRVSTAVQGNPGESEKKLQTFTRRLIPLIAQYWPVEEEQDRQKVIVESKAR